MSRIIAVLQTKRGGVATGSSDSGGELTGLLADDLDQGALLPSSIEFALEICSWHSPHRSLFATQSNEQGCGAFLRQAVSD
jgi:hypothetical protein